MVQIYEILKKQNFYKKDVVPCFACVVVFKVFYDILFNFYQIYLTDYQYLLNFINNYFLYLV
ncbi:hypothetical protein DDI74_10205 [Chryseobacterium gleum]|nr:hypothetical protein DDI74_10205 [Chryseobacterium gleum]